MMHVRFSDWQSVKRAIDQVIDWMLHVNPKLKEKGMLIAFNPLDEPVEKNIQVPLYYTGLQTTAQVLQQGNDAHAYPISREYTIDLRVNVPANAMTWYVIE